MLINSDVSLFIFCPNVYNLSNLLETVLLFLVDVNLGLSCFVMKVNGTEFGAYMFRLVIPPWLSVPLFRMKCPSLSHLSSFSLSLFV